MAAEPTAPPEMTALDKERLRRGREEGIAAYGDLGLDLATFSRSSAALARARVLSRGGTEATVGEAVSRHLATAALGDLYLALAAEHGDPRAWDLLSAAFRPRLEAVAMRRGLPRGEAEATVQDLLGDLAGPPPRARARTLLGTFDGSGSLFAWLSLVLMRRIAARGRTRRPTLLGDGVEEAEAEARERTPRQDDPAETSLDAETAARFGAALRQAWETLTPQERLALAAKHRDGLTQRRVGDLLGVGEARVSRIIASAVAKVTASVRAVADGEGPGAAQALWRRLEGAVSAHWARVGAEPPPTEGGGPRRPGGASPPPDREIREP